MSKTLTDDLIHGEPVDYEAATIECIKEIDRKLEKITAAQQETARLREETYATLERLKVA